ncbi:hypothetical protein DL764_002908 [Monosporascus ibericus]|uniref:Ketoreductase (KR) domain-containing protein n=1 Tax=Monosporascus ibericus TaxID=155417 RepID=A0A4Q4TMS4_9PEZI|nr:hypothetical protein DL764_002908 [Monosporascus ibericus]
MAPRLDFNGKTVFVTGGSAGLGLEISKAVAAQGAHVTIFARRQKLLDEARSIIKDVRRSKEQEINAVSVNLADAEEVDSVFRAQPRLPDMLFCCAGGTPGQVGFINDLTPVQLETCMQNNYLTAAFSAQMMLKIWTEDDKTAKGTTPLTRHIVFINSVAAFCTVPGMGAYSAPKSAVRGLADCLRMEALVYSSPTRKYSIHCAFPSTFISDAFFEEQKGKPLLTKEIEGTVGTPEELMRKHPSAKKEADLILAGVAKGDFAICDESVESPILFANMVGVSPRRGLGIYDTIMSLVMAFAWPLIGRPWWDGLCKKYSPTWHASRKP